MHFHPNEMYLYYDPSTTQGKKVRAYAQSVNEHINDFDLNKVKITGTIWLELLDLLQMTPRDLMDESDPEYQDEIHGDSLDQEGWLHVLQQNPQFIKAPIAIYRDKAKLCVNPTDVLELG